jgi:hypothetical protein
MAGVIGLGLQNPPLTLVSTMNSISQKYVIPTLGDTIFIPSPTWWALTRLGKKFGMGEIVYPEIFQEEMTGGAYFGDQLLDTAVVDSVQPADQVWRFYRQSMAIPITDIILNRGGYLNLVKSKYEIASASFLQKLSRALWGTSPQNTSLDIDNIPAWLLSTTNTIAGINRSTAANAFWKPQANAVLGGTITPGQLEDLYQSTVFGYDEPDILTMTNACYSKFKQNYIPTASSQGQVRFLREDVEDKAPQGSIRNHFMFNNALVLPDRFNPATYCYLMNSKYMYPVFHEADYFTVDPFIKPSNQRVIVSTLYLTLQLINRSPRMGGAASGAPA